MRSAGGSWRFQNSRRWPRQSPARSGRLRLAAGRPRAAPAAAAPPPQSAHPPARATAVAARAQSLNQPPACRPACAHRRRSHPGWCDDRSYTNADAILAANYPVIVTEFGDQNSAGTSGAPFASTLLPKLDARGISYLGWTFTVAQDTNNVLIKDNNGTPTDGYGVYVKAHYLCRAAGTTSCQ